MPNKPKPNEIGVRMVGFISGENERYYQLVNGARALCYQCNGIMDTDEFFTKTRLPGVFGERMVCTTCRPFKGYRPPKWGEYDPEYGSVAKRAKAELKAQRKAVNIARNEALQRAAAERRAAWALLTKAQRKAAARAAKDERRAAKATVAE